MSRVIKFRFGFKVGNSVVFQFMDLNELADCNFALESMLTAVNEDLGLYDNDEVEEFEYISKDQFTGLTDKNDVDIYQDDIIQFADKYEWYRSPYHSAEKVKEIINDDVKYPYERRVVKLPEDYEWLLSSEIQSCWEVIGNIHQHPELLK